ncbi:mannosyltransferase [Mortierella claussenii]|nr:mannosyltransferase [Mortierella claussenii]
MPSSAAGLHLRVKNGTVSVPGTVENPRTASSTATDIKAALKYRLNAKNAQTNNGGIDEPSSPKPSGILTGRKTLSEDRDDDLDNNNSDDDLNSNSGDEDLDSDSTAETIASLQYAHSGHLYKTHPPSHHRDWPYCPSFSVAFKALFLVRALAATYSNISDCDEVFNFWEPMHYLQYGTGLETWEYSPVFAIRSWAYILAHALPAEITRLAMSANRVRAVSAHCEATLYRTVVDEVDPRIGRYLLLALASSAGTWIASNGEDLSTSPFLPSTFAMYTTMLFFSQMLQSPHQHSGKRAFWAIFWVGLGALLGWPFSAAVGLPFALEELLIHSRDHSKKKIVRFSDWRMTRLARLVTSAVAVLGCVLIPIIIIDQYYYKKLVVVPLNIVLYNVFGGDVGPDIFGTEPWWFYILNGLLNFNILFPAALLSFPILLVVRFTIPEALPNPSFGLGIKDPLLWFTLKLSPFYLWFAIFTAQPHKEERFLFVVYPLICFNAVLTLFLGQKMVQSILNRCITRSKTAAIHKYSAGLVWVILVASAAVSLSRILALYDHYNAPIEVYRKAFDLVKVPEPFIIEGSKHAASSSAASGGILTDRAHHEKIRVCVGKEWYRFPSHYFLPEGAKLGLLKSHFDGLLPGEFVETTGLLDLPPPPTKPSAVKGKEHRPMRIDWRWSSERRPGTSFIPPLMNNQNKEVHEYYTPLNQCHYLVDLDYSGRYSESEDKNSNSAQEQDLIEPRYLQNKEHWEKLYCKRFLDTQVGAGRNRWVRAFWIPDKITMALTRGQPKVWGDYCLARRKSTAV